MFQTLKNAFTTPDIRKKILITFGLLLIYRVGCFVPIPGLDSSLIFGGASETDFGLMLSAITGSALSPNSAVRMRATAIGCIMYGSPERLRCPRWASSANNNASSTLA